MYDKSYICILGKAWESLATNTSPKDADLVFLAFKVGSFFLRSHVCHPDVYPNLGTWQNQVVGSSGHVGAYVTAQLTERGASACKREAELVGWRGVEGIQLRGEG